MPCQIVPSQTLPKTARFSTIPGDKSMSHRLVILGSLAEGTLEVTGFLRSDDCLNTVAIFRQLGVDIEVSDEVVRIHGVGLSGLREPAGVLDVGNSGTAIRLIAGVLAGQRFSSTLTGDASIRKRPMKRVLDPLRQMNADVRGQDGGVAPLVVAPSTLSAIRYELPVASAQVKSCVILAGLYAHGVTTVVEPELCRDHTERLLRFFGVDCQRNGDEISLRPPTKLEPSQSRVVVPSDVSSAAFFIVLGALLGLPWEFDHIGLNPTRRQVIDVLQRMGVGMRVSASDEMEPMGDIVLTGGALQSTEIPAEWIPFIIDEIPILAIAGLRSKDGLIVRGAEELRVKESDRIAKIVALVRAMGGPIDEYTDGFKVYPLDRATDFAFDCAFDHRLAMSAIVGALVYGVGCQISGWESIQTSFPNFFELLDDLGVDYQLS